MLLEPLFLRVGENAVDQLFGFTRRQVRTLRPLQLSMDADLRRRVGRQVQVRSVHVDRQLQKFRQCGH
jgi:hypothetical protein